jgi:hypothetical protein
MGGAGRQSPIRDSIFTAFSSRWVKIVGVKWKFLPKDADLPGLVRVPDQEDHAPSDQSRSFPKPPQPPQSDRFVKKTLRLHNILIGEEMPSPPSPERG